MKKDLKITNAKVLGSPDKIKWSQEADGLKVTMPTEKPGDFAYVIQFDF